MRKTLVHLIVGILVLPLLLILPARADCTGEAECYDLTPAPSGSGWPPDDRLNPVQDEYYTVYCHYDQIEVWRGVGGSAQLASIPIAQVMRASRPFNAGNGLRVSRSGDTVTISGANGNGPTHPGAKSFSLEECFLRNGGQPAAPVVSGSQQEASIAPPPEACTYYFGFDPLLTPQLDILSSADSVIGSDGTCQKPPTGTVCEFVAVIAFGSFSDRFVTVPMPGVVNDSGDCEANSNPVLLMTGFLRALINFICLGVYVVPLGGAGLWWRHKRRKLEIYHRSGKTLPFGR